MFLTQVAPIKRSNSAYLSPKRTSIQVTANMTFHNSPHGSDSNLNTKKLVSRRFQPAKFTNISKSAVKKYQKLTPEQKWRKMVNFFQCKNDAGQKVISQYPSLYSCLLKVNLSKGNFRFNLPETFIIDQQSSLQLLSTENETICRKPVNKRQVITQLEEAHEKSMKVLKDNKKYDHYADILDYNVNNNTPFIVVRQLFCEEDKCSIQVQSYKNFKENRWRVTNEHLVQRYIYSRNLKAMILRVCYEKSQRGSQKQEYCVYRFQNLMDIFRSDNYQSHDLRAKISPSLRRLYTFQSSKLTGPGVLKKIIQPTNEIRRLLQTITEKRLLKLNVDFIEDLSGKLWVIGYKGAVFEQIVKIAKKENWLITSQVGYCRLCNGLFQKKELQNSVSVRMLLEFLHHLKQRTRIQDQNNVQFTSILSLNKKENAMSAVCQCCYALIIHELELKKYEILLGKLCHIRVDDDVEISKYEGVELRQWRFMVYLQEIKEISNGVGRIQNLVVRYALGRGIEEKWKCNIDHGVVKVQRVKVHYFYSESLDIEEFLKNSEIVISVLSMEGQEVLAQGSTGIMANFKNKFTIQSGQRQTTTVLLFFQSGKYCELTLKVGLVYDGIYNSPQVPLKKSHSILFPTKDCLNSNPLPKEWMQAFGHDQQISLKQIKYQQLFKGKKTYGISPVPTASKLKKKAIKFS